MTLGKFLKAAANNRVPGNCSTLPADWLLTLGFPDFAAPWRETTGDAADAVLAGELVGHWDAAIGTALPVVTSPFLPGDIGIVRRLIWEAGAIFTGERWAFQRRRGLAFAPMPDEAIIKAWRPCRTS